MVPVISLKITRCIFKGMTGFLSVIYEKTPVKISRLMLTFAGV